MSEFKAFPPIGRLFKGMGCVVTEKIDGTNALVYVSDDGSEVKAGSRNRWVTRASDNFGWAAWVEDHAEELKQLGPGYHYGEWWGSGIQRRYGLSEKRFSLFNVGRWQANPPPACCHVVPVLYRGQFETSKLREVADALKELGSTAAPGFMDPEGIVVFHMATKSLFKFTLDGDGHKGEQKEAAE